VEVRPITNLRAEQAVMFFTDIVYRFGVPNSIITDNGSQFTGQKDPGVLRQVPHPRGLGSCGTPTNQRPSGACQRHDSTRPQAQNFRPAEQVWSEMAPGAAGGRMEPQDHAMKSHRVHPIFSSPWRGGRPPHGLGIRIAQSAGLRRRCQSADPRGFAGPVG
jgi:hypothetical protein